MLRHFKSGTDQQVLGQVFFIRAPVFLGLPVVSAAFSSITHEPMATLLGLFALTGPAAAAAATPHKPLVKPNIV